MHIRYYIVIFIERDWKRNTYEVMNSTSPLGTHGSVASLLAATFYQRNHDRNHKL